MKAKGWDVTGARYDFGGEVKVAAAIRARPDAQYIGVQNGWRVTLEETPAETG